MSLHFARQLRWVSKSWDEAHAELESPFNEFVLTDEFTQDHAEFEYDAVIDRACRYARKSSVTTTEDSTEEADLNINRYVPPCRTIVVVADEDTNPKPEMPGVHLHALQDTPYDYRFAVDAIDSLLIIYRDGSCVAASCSKNGKKWLSRLKVDT
jgi:hypothetical protein